MKEYESGVDLAFEQGLRNFESSIWMYLTEDFDTEKLWKLSDSILKELRENIIEVLQDEN